MVAKDAQATREPPRKRPKLEHKKTPRKFTSVEEIRAGLRLQNPEGLTETFTALRNQLSIKPGEDVISPQDERLLLAQHWMENVPGAHDIFEIWDNTTQRQTSALALIVSVLSSLLSLLSSHYTFHVLGQPILKTLLTPTYTRRLNSYLGGSHSELILTTLKLYNGMSAFAGGRERSAVLDAFGWEIKSLPKILNMRRKTKGEEVVDPLVKPDIRTLYILFLLSFVDAGSSTQTKTTFLEQHRDTFLSIFKGLVQDSYSVARKILEVCWGGVWSDPKIKRTVKIGLFNESTISHIVKLYERSASEDDETEQVPADLVHHFLLAICTRPGVGICFKDRGWYPRQAEGEDRLGKEDDDDYESMKRGGKIYNKILSNILKTLKANEDVRQQELAMKILTACPELVAGYWSAAALTLEPRLSSKWIANISLFGSIISLPIPSDSFHLPKSTLYQPTPPPLHTIMENILPSVNTKVHFSKGLLSSSGLVQHCTALALAKCLDKYQQVLTLFSQIETLLEESETDGQWCKRRRDIEREARRRIPEFQVIVAFSQQKSSEGLAVAPGSITVPPNPIRAALLSEAAQRLLWMYHRCLPLVVAEARFDVGKLLQGFSTEMQASKGDSDSDDQDEPPDAAVKLNMVRQLHVLRLLKDSDQFVWSGKMGSSSPSYLATLLKAYAVSDHPATRGALAVLLHHVLAESIMFQEDPDEPHLWLSSLPTSRRAPGSESPDGAPLTGEADGVVSFLDDCVQRCMKTPYRYIEDLYSFGDSENQQSNEIFTGRFDIYPSPLLMTVLEQLDIKVEKKILSVSDVLALASFLRKLVYRLMTKQQGLQFLQRVLVKLDEILDSSRLFPHYPVVTSAIRREVSLLRTCLAGPQVPSSQSNHQSQATQDFLTQVEKLPIPASKSQRTLAACEFIDWVRLVDHPFDQSQLCRVADILLAFNPPAITDLAECADPIQGLLWRGLDIPSRFAELQKHLQFDSLFLHSGEAEIGHAASRSILVEVAFGGVSSLLNIKQAVSLVTHRLMAVRSQDTLTKGLLLLLTSIVQRASTIFSAEDNVALKEAIFAYSEVIRIYLVSETVSDLVRESLHNLVKVSLNPTNSTDQMVLTETTTYWLDALKKSLTGEPIKSALILTWIPYFRSSDLLDVLDTLAITSNLPSLPVLETVLQSLRSSAEADLSAKLALNFKSRLPQLLSLRKAAPSLGVLEEIIAVAIVSSLPAYCDRSELTGKVFEETAMNPIILRSRIRWSQHLDHLSNDLPLQSFLDQAIWTPSTIEILSSLLYRRWISKDRFLSWLETDSPKRHSADQLIPVLHAFLDASSCEGSQIDEPNVDAWLSLVTRLLDVTITEDLPSTLRSTSRTCIALIASIAPLCLPRILASIIQTIDALPVASLTMNLLKLGRQLHLAFSVDTTPLVTALVNHGMQWAVRHFAEEGEPFEAVVEELTCLVQVSSDVKPHLVETVIGVVIQHHLANVPALQLITSLLSIVQLKPVIVNRFLQSIIQHPQIFKLCGSTVSSTHATRDAIINTLYVLFDLHPHNTCQITHVEPLVRLYRGTLSVSDGQILKIFRLFETQRKMSIAPLLNCWSSSPDLPSVTSLDAIHSLDPIVVLRTCLSFPSWRRLEDPSTEKATAHDSQLYDPIFLILLFSQTLVENPPSSAFAWVELFRTNIVSLLIRAMSSKDDRIREVALSQIAGLWKCLVDADLQEKPHVLYILTLIKNLLPAPSGESPKRFPSYTTLILLHALRGIFYPSNFIYPITARFLLQRPELDIADVPMLYNMLYSSTDDWKKERGWIIRFLSDGMMSTEDWRVLKRRHTWDLLASLFQSSEGDHALRRGIFEILANLTCNAQATTSLILKSGLLTWIEMQLIISRERETVEWIKILDNIMTIGNSEKFESATNGDWRDVIGRCLDMLLNPDRTANASSIFPFAASALLRLVLLKGPCIADLSRLLDHGLAHLKQMELTLVIPPSGTRLYTSKKTIPTAPYRAHDIHELYSDEDRLRTWGNVVEALWRVAMSLDDKDPVWGALTSRLLVWRAIVGAEGSSLGEWARKQVVYNMGI
ncbi:ribosome 60S biogenesis N-terminal-domain-containing protein [Collybia nuda]|uniref:Ribosome 60S biogenesis N-terminal-domain-containing protein n=1 Tax=Collybia nuda TaxID=64659 RepID=A0A9P5Y4A7_9AGAR|nr:ribosome 60S biogenesis N-terminal-domain-containing protein [Collybia nuda]